MLQWSCHTENDFKGRHACFLLVFLLFSTYQQSSTTQSTKVPDVAGQSPLLDVCHFSHRKQEEQIGQDTTEGQR